jgi:hypothetical protein
MKLGREWMETGWNMLKDRNETIFQAEEFMIHPRQNRTKTTLSPKFIQQSQSKLFLLWQLFCDTLDTQQALPSTRVASWRNFVKNDTYTVAADASQVLITRCFLLQNETGGWVSKLVPRLRISESHFVADFHNGHLFVVYPKIDIEWHSTVTQYRWHSNGESED